MPINKEINNNKNCDRNEHIKMNVITIKKNEIIILERPRRSMHFYIMVVKNMLLTDLGIRN